MRQPVLTALCLLLAQSFSITAQADVEIRVDPKVVQECRPAHLFASVNNDSNEPMEVDVTASLALGNRRAEMVLGHVVIAAGESYVQEFEFVMPAVPLGSYLVTVRAELADNSSMEGSDRFTVRRWAQFVDCQQGDTPQDFLSLLAMSLPVPTAETSIKPGFQEIGEAYSSTSTSPTTAKSTSRTSTTSNTSWQSFKMLYR